MSVDRKKTVNTVCFGTCLYVFMMLAIGMALLAAAFFAKAISLEIESQGAFWEGIISVISVIISASLLYRYAVKQKENGNIFVPDESVRSAVSEKNRSMSAARLLMLAAVVFFMQLVIQQIFELMELGLNAAGLTAKASTAAVSGVGVTVTALIYSVIVGPITEELVFRGFIMKGLKPCGKLFAILVSALLFGLMHGDIYQLLSTLAAGVILGYVAMEYSIYSALILHIINNGLYGAVLGYIEEHSPLAHQAVSAVLGIAGAAVTVYFLVKYRGYMKEYIAQNRSEKGTAGYLLNKWFILFVIFMCIQVIRSIKPLLL